ncbi:MAG: hypothetical protein ABI409_19240 [Ramlibacter sp.]
MASFAHPHHPSHSEWVRAEIAAQGAQHIEFTVEQLVRLAKRVAAAIEPTLKRWADAHRQAAQDRIFWELALTDRRVMDDLIGAQARAEARRTR